MIHLSLSLPILLAERCGRLLFLRRETVQRGLEEWPHGVDFYTRRHQEAGWERRLPLKRPPLV
jgi:hypothetical protein